MTQQAYYQNDAPRQLRMDGAAAYEPHVGQRALICPRCGGPNDGPGDICGSCCFEWAEHNETTELSKT